MVNAMYPPELQLNKGNASYTEAPFLDLHLSVSNGFVSSKIHDKRDDFDIERTRECHNKLTQPILSTMRKRIPIQYNFYNL